MNTRSMVGKKKLYGYLTKGEVSIFDEYLGLRGLNKREYFENKIIDELDKAGIPHNFKKNKDEKFQDMQIDGALGLPIFNWSKSMVIRGILEINKSLDKSLLDKVFGEVLNKHFLTLSEYDATGNYTDKYVINKKVVKEATNDSIREMIQESINLSEKKKKDKIKDREIEQERELLKKKSIEEKKKYEMLLKYTPYKTVRGFKAAIGYGKCTIQEVEALRRDTIALKRKELKIKWQNEGNMEYLEKINDDAFIDSFITGILK